MRTFRYLLLLPVLAVLLTSSGDGAFDAQINTIKAECKGLIKDARYEGSKVTYFIPSASKQTKAVELFLFLNNEYVFAVSGKKCESPVTLKIYDAAADVEERTLIKEIKSIEGQTLQFSGNELNKAYRKKVPEVERLKSLHVEYSIGSGKGSKEAVVLVFGHK